MKQATFQICEQSDVNKHVKSHATFSNSESKKENTSIKPIKIVENVYYFTK
jgi:hypothetical protein